MILGNSFGNFGAFGASTAQVAECVADLKTKLSAAGFTIGPGTDVDNDTYWDAALLTDRATAGRLSALGVAWDQRQTPAVMQAQVDACNAVKTALASKSWLILLGIAAAASVAAKATKVIEDKAVSVIKPMIAPPDLSSVGLYVGLGIVVVAAGVGVYAVSKGK
jgi:hypothetical protein